MKYRSILLAISLNFPAFAMELPFGPNKQTIENAVNLLEKGNEEEKKEGFKQLALLSAQDPEAGYSLACTYEYGTLSSTNTPIPKLAFSKMKQAADKNYGPSFIKMGRYYSQGFGTPMNFDYAVDYYKKALKWYETHRKLYDIIALENPKIAQSELAKIYITHYKNDQQRLNEGLGILEKQVSENSEYAAITLAQYYEDKSDYQNAKKYYLAALRIKPDREETKVQLANLYLFRFSHEPEKIQLAETYLKEAVANSRNEKAAFRLCYYYYDQERFDEVKENLTLVTNPYFLAPKYVLEGLLYSHERNKSKDLPKALALFEKGLKASPHDDVALFGIWKIWLESPELIEDQQKIKDILNKLHATKNPQILFKLGLGHKYGFYGLEKNKTKAEECFTAVLADTSQDSDALIALIYGEGIYGKKDLNQALKALQRSRLKSKWTEELYSKILEEQHQELIEEEEKEKRSKIRSPKKIPSTKVAPEIASPSTSSLALKNEVPANKTTSEAHEFEQEPEIHEEPEAFKHELIRDIDTTYRPDDGSFVKDINFKTGEIFIEDPMHHKRIILSFKDDTQTVKKRKRRIIKQLQYHPRVEVWFTKSREELLKKYSPSTIDNHTFAKVVDNYIQLYGIRIPRPDNKLELVLPGTIVDTITGKKQKVDVEYAFYQDDPGNSKKINYHRLTRPVYT